MKLNDGLLPSNRVACGAKHGGKTPPCLTPYSCHCLFTARYFLAAKVAPTKLLQIHSEMLDCSYRCGSENFMTWGLYMAV